MSEYLIQDTTLTAIANAIREKTGGTDQMTPEQMATEIFSIKSGDDESFKRVIERNALKPTLPSDLTNIGNYAFSDCTSLALTSLPAGVENIGAYAFNNCTHLALTSLPSGVTSIGDNAFDECTNLTSITFEGTPATISSTAFKNCTNLTTINVPWAEGAVANAPWGASNATINYNYTGS